MKQIYCKVGLFCLALGLSALPLAMAMPPTRVANTTLAMPAAPPAFGYTWSNAFGALIFTNPVAMAAPPGETNRLFVLEKKGRIIVITNLANPTRALFLNIVSRVISDVDTSVGGEEGLLGIAFHPGYATNRTFFLYYTGNATTSDGSANSRHDILGRYQTSEADPNVALTNETRLFAQYDEAFNHNGGDIQFGPDGYLYVPVGDEGGAEGQYGNTQRIDRDLFSAVMRLDVDKLPGNLPPNAHPAATANYLVPADNPFIGQTTFNGLAVDPAKVRTEFWAVGLRNPWRMNFDPLTGYLYCADVGQGNREEIDLITKGANYGWNYWEGVVPRTNDLQIPTSFVKTPPIIDYAHTNGNNAVVGGSVYRGSRLSQLYGAYIYGDYGSGRIWALRYNGTNVTTNTLLFADPGISTLGVDPSNGDILYVKLNSGINSVIKRIVYTSSPTGPPLPPTLADTGAFADPAQLAPNAGILPYDINVPFWSDNALKSRWFSVPNASLQLGFSASANWSFPTGTVWIKHFELELTNGVPASRKRLETRLLVKNSGGVYGVTYRWGNSTNNATLVPEEGLDEPFAINDGGIMRTQIWHYPGRSECVQCHTAVAGFALGFNTPQMNRDFDYGTGATNQIAALAAAGYFSSNPGGIHNWRALVPANDANASVESRVRSYLAANCVQCHQPGGAALGWWDARLTTATRQAGIINGALVNPGGDPANRVLKPGSPARSMMLTRLTNLGPAHMPPLATSVVNSEAVALLNNWITADLPTYPDFTDWQLAIFGSTNNPAAAMDADPDRDGNGNYFEFLTQTSPTNALDAWKPFVSVSNGMAKIAFEQTANRGFEVQGNTNLLFPGSWLPLNVPGNEPFFPATNRPASVEEPVAPSGSRFYRMRVFEP